MTLPIALAEAPAVNFLYPAGAQRGKTTEIKINGKSGTSPSVAVNHTGIDIKFNEKKDGLSVTVDENVQKGVYWVRFWNAEGASPLKPLIVSNTAEHIEKETNNEISQAETVPSTCVVNGVLQASNDVDIYAVELKKGQTLVASMLANNVLESPMDGILQILAPKGYVVEQNDDDQSFDPEATYTAAEDGVHYVRAFAFPSKPNSSVRFSGAATYVYRLTITTGPFIDHVYPSVIKRGVETTVNLSGWNIADELRNIKVPANADGDRFLIDHPAFANAVDVQLLDGETSIVEQEPNGRDKPQKITVPVSISGRFQQMKDADVYEFEAKKGQRFNFNVESRSLGQLTDPVLQVLRADGTVLKRVETRSATAIDEKLNQAFSADGMYRVEVFDLHKRGGSRFAYRLSIKPESADFQLTVAADSFVLEPDKPLEIPITVARIDRFNEEIEIRAEGLPEGVEVPVVKSEKKGATAKSVKLKLTSKQAAAFSGEIRIVGKALVEQPFENLATATVSAKNEALWLTIKPPKKPVEEKKEADK